MHAQESGANDTLPKGVCPLTSGYVGNSAPLPPLTPLSFYMFLSTCRDDQITHLWPQKPKQPAHALNLNLLDVDTLFE